MTEIENFHIHDDGGAFANDLYFTVEASRISCGSWTINRAVLDSHVLWFDEKHAEKEAFSLSERTPGFLKYLNDHDGMRERLRDELEKQWERDQEEIREKSQQTFRDAVKNGVD